MAQIADGAIVGSACVNIVAEYGRQAPAKLTDYTKQMKAAVNANPGEIGTTVYKNRNHSSKPLTCGSCFCRSGQLKTNCSADNNKFIILLLIIT